MPSIRFALALALAILSALASRPVEAQCVLESAETFALSIRGVREVPIDETALREILRSSLEDSGLGVWNSPNADCLLRVTIDTCVLTASQDSFVSLRVQVAFLLGVTMSQFCGETPCLHLPPLWEQESRSIATASSVNSDIQWWAQQLLKAYGTAVRKARTAQAEAGGA